MVQIIRYGHRIPPFALSNGQSRHAGDILHLRNWSSHIIVLNSEKAIRDVFARRAENYSDRMQTPMYCDPSLVDRGKTVFSTNYGERFRRYSKLLHQALSKSAIAAYEGVQAEATDRMLADIARKPEAFVQHIRAYVRMGNGKQGGADGTALIGARRG